MSPMTPGMVIVGGGLAAVRTAEQLRRQDYTGPLTILCAEAHLPYDRPPLSKDLLRGEIDHTTLKPADFYAQHHITVRLGSRVTGVDTQAHTVALADGSVVGYDQLIVATGLVPRRIPSFGDLDGIGVLRSYDDALELRRRAATARHAVVVGAGFIGCEVAASLRRLGVDVLLAEPQPAPLASVLGERAGEWVARLHRAEGVDVRTGVTVAEVRGDGRVESVVLSDGSEIEADLVVVGVGSQPATEWLAGSGIEIADGVVCDESGRTSAADVWAIGDVASWWDRSSRQVRVEHWSNVAEQARIMVAALLDVDAADRASVPYFWSDQYDVKIQFLGQPQSAVHVVEDTERRFLAYYERDGVVVGVVGAGAADKIRQARTQIATGAPVSEVLPQPTQPADRVPA
ncbi:MAG TPA: FAD/NAD(P)-binding oxidoreductase [Mycobacterium sp.]|nr:FAD/NAD(P)-binding oxidoreductase [Mycobacterium sp.]